MKKLSLATLIVSVGLTGCVSSAIKNIDAYQKVPLQNAEKMPSPAALSGTKARVIVFEFDDRKAAGAGIGDTAADLVTKELNATNNVKIIDRNLAQQLGKEITLAETKGHGGYRGQDVSDIAITGKITQASAGIAFQAATSYQDKDGKYHTNPAQCNTSGKAAVSIKILQVPSLDAIQTIDVEAKYSNSVDAQYYGCPRLSREDQNGVVVAALTSAIQKAHTELKNQFAPSGYISERRTFEKSNIFRTTLGKTLGAKQDLKVVVMHEVSETDPLTNVVSKEYVKVAEGVISDQIGDSYSYILVADPASADKIKRGDMVKGQFEDSFGDMLNKVAH